MESRLPTTFLQVMRLIRDQAHLEADPKMLPPPEFMALKYFEEHPSSTLSLFAEFIHVRKPTATELIKRLLLRDFLKRVQSKTDKRAFELELTKEGTKALQEAEKAFELYAGRVFATLSEGEQDQLFQLLLKITHKKNA